MRTTAFSAVSLASALGSLLASLSSCGSSTFGSGPDTGTAIEAGEDVEPDTVIVVSHPDGTVGDAASEADATSEGLDASGLVDSKGMDAGCALGMVHDDAGVCVPQLSVTGGAVTATATFPLYGCFANVIDALGATNLAHLVASIDWGDGTTSSGTAVKLNIHPSNPRVVLVESDHTYASPGNVTIVVVVSDALTNAAAQVSLMTSVYPASQGSKTTAFTMANANPQTIVAGSHAGLPGVWFAQIPPQADLVFLPFGDAGAPTSIPAGSAPRRVIAVGGNLYVTEYTNPGTIDAFAMADGSSIAGFPVTGLGANTDGITVGPSGNLWFVERGLGYISYVTPAGAAGGTFPSTPMSTPIDITYQSHSLWVTENAASGIVQFSESGVLQTRFPTSAAPVRIIVGPDGNLWFSETSPAGNNIGRLAITGELTEFPVRTTGAGPGYLAVGADGNLWFTEQAGPVGRITPTGAITEFPIPNAIAPTQPTDIRHHVGNRRQHLVYRVRDRLRELSESEVVKDRVCPFSAGGTRASPASSVGCGPPCASRGWCQCAWCRRHCPRSSSACACFRASAVGRASMTR
jgi:streptogramin lyase